MEGGAFADFRIRAHTAAVPRNDTVHDRHAYARAFEILGLVQALENAEEFWCVFHVESDSVVLHPEQRVAILAFAGDQDLRLGRDVLPTSQSSPINPKTAKKNMNMPAAPWRNPWAASFPRE